MQILFLPINDAKLIRSRSNRHNAIRNIGLVEQSVPGKHGKDICFVILDRYVQSENRKMGSKNRIMKHQIAEIYNQIMEMYWNVMSKQTAWQWCH